MRALHRMVVTGAFGGLAAATLAASGAFACSATARVWASGAGEGQPLPAVITTGTVLDVHVEDFYATGKDAAGKNISEVEITWLYQKNADGSWTGESLGKISLARPEIIENGKVVGHKSVADETVVPFTIPKVMPASGFHHLKAELKIDGVVAWAPSWEVKVPTAYLPGEEPTPDPDPGPGSDPVVVLPPVENTDAVTQPDPKTDTASGPITSTETAVDTKRPQPAPVATPAPPRRTRTFATPSALTELDSSRPAGVTVSPGAEQAARAAAPLTDDWGGGNGVQPGANDLWSGLERGSSLGDDPPAPPPGGGSNPAGGILLGSGIIAMMGVAVACGRRRVAALRARA